MQETRGEKREQGLGDLGVQRTKTKVVWCSWARVLFCPKEVDNATEHMCELL